jgi:hypothetical protein
VGGVGQRTIPNRADRFQVNDWESVLGCRCQGVDELVLFAGGNNNYDSSSRLCRSKLGGCTGLCRSL